MRITCVAAMEADKGHRVLLDAVGRLIRDGEAVDVDLAGDGPLHQELRRQCERLGIADRVQFLGLLTEPEVTRVVDRADAFVLASLVAPDGDTDGIPVALMEAMAAGVPVVASDVSRACPSSCAMARPGCWRPPDDDAALADALRSLRADPSSAIARARAGRALVEERFTVEGEASRLLDLVRGSSAGGSAGRVARALDRSER